MGSVYGTTKGAARKPNEPAGSRGAARSPLQGHPIHRLSQAIGNRAVARMSAEESEEVARASKKTARVTVSSPVDSLEVAADRAAARVMARSSVALPGAESVAASRVVDRTPGVSVGSEEEGEPVVARACSGCRDEVARKSASGGLELSVSEETRSEIDRPGAGKPLSAALRARLEAGLEANLGSVRVHQSGRAQRAAADLDARAFTVGDDIWLGRGESASDVALMAHEAAHVVQQLGPRTGSAPQWDQGTGRGMRQTRRGARAPPIGADRLAQTASVVRRNARSSEPRSASGYARSRGRRLPALATRSAAARPRSSRGSPPGSVRRAHRPSLGTGTRETANPPRVARSSNVSPQAAAGEVVHRASEPVAQRGILDDLRYGAEQLYDDASEVVEDVVEGGGELVDYGLEWAEAQLVDLLGDKAALVLELVRNPLGFLKRKASQLASGVLSTIAAPIAGPISLMSGIVPNVAALGGRVASIASDVASGDCSSLFAAAGQLADFVSGLMEPIIAPIQSGIGAITSTLSGLWNEYAAERLDQARGIGKAIWDEISRVVGLAWEATAGLRGLGARAWNVYKEHFDVAWDGAGALIDELWSLAGEAWSWLKKKLGPAFAPVLTVVGSLAGVVYAPILLPIIGAVGVWQAVQFIREHWDDVENFLVNARDVLLLQVLPAIQSGARSLMSALASAGRALQEGLGVVANGLDTVLDGFEQLPLLGSLVGLLRPLAGSLRGAVTRLSEGLVTLLGDVREGIGALAEVLRPVAVVVAAIVLFPIYPWMLPTVLAGWAWQLLPDCFKPAIIDFFLECAIGFVEVMPGPAIFGEGWGMLKGSVLEALRETQAQDQATKVAASNRVARMMSGEDLSWIPNLVRATMGMPPFFWPEASKEFFGKDLSEPLPFEVLGQGGGGTRAAADDALTAAVLDRFERGELRDGDVEMARVANVSIEPELSRELASIASTRPGERIPLGPGLDEFLPPELTSGGAATGPEAEEADALPPSSDEQIELLLAQARRGGMDPCAGGASGPPQPASAPPARVFGPFTVAERLTYMVGSIGVAISNWFDCNKHWIVPTAIAVVAALVIAEVLTGGAITGALPGILEAIGVIFIGYSAVRAAGYIGAFVSQALSGNVAEASRSLARGLAIASIEIVSELIFPAAAAALRGARRVTRAGTRMVNNAARRGAAGVRRGASQVTRGASAAFRPLVRRGKVVLGAVDDSVSRGVRTVDDFYQKMRRQLTEFGAFWMVVRGRRFEIWARFNPTMLILAGRVPSTDVMNARKGPGDLVDVTVQGGRPSLGDELFLADHPQVRGIIVGVWDENVSAGVRRLREMSPDEMNVFLRSLEGLSDQQRRARVIALAGREAQLPFPTTTPAMRRQVQEKPYRDPRDPSTAPPPPRARRVRGDHVAGPRVPGQQDRRVARLPEVARYSAGQRAPNHPGHRGHRQQHPAASQEYQRVEGEPDRIGVDDLPWRASRSRLRGLARGRAGRCTATNPARDQRVPTRRMIDRRGLDE